MVVFYAVRFFLFGVAIFNARVVVSVVSVAIFDAIFVVSDAIFDVTVVAVGAVHFLLEPSAAVSAMAVEELLPQGDCVRPLDDNDLPCA